MSAWIFSSVCLLCTDWRQRERLGELFWSVFSETLYVKSTLNLFGKTQDQEQAMSFPLVCVWTSALAANSVWANMGAAGLALQMVHSKQVSPFDAILTSWIVFLLNSLRKHRA